MTKNLVQGDVISFKASDNKYKALLCVNVNRERSPHYYDFAALTYSDERIPQLSDIINSEFYGIGNRKGDHFKYTNEELDKMWVVHPEVKPYYLGVYGLTIWRKQFMVFGRNFVTIGNLHIVYNLNKHGNGCMNANDIDVIDHLFVSGLDETMAYWGQKSFSVKAVLKD